MKIRAIEVIPVSVPIVPERITVGARGRHDRSPFLVIRISTDEGITGLGEVSCTPGWSGEDQMTAARFIDRVLAPRLLGQDPLRITHLASLMSMALANNPFTRAGIELALWDIAGKATGQPLYVLLGGKVREHVRTKYSVSGLPADEAAELALWAVAQGFDAMKVKVGIEPRSDLDRVRAVRDAIGPGIMLGVDVNGGWTPSIVKRVAPALAELDIAFIEQPIPPGDPRRLAQVRMATSLPVIADESLSTAQDALALIDAGAADAFSIYVGMGAGLREALAVAAIANAANVSCTVGSNLELGIAQSAMIHLAVSQPAIDPEQFPCDIISRFFYVGDIVSESLPVDAGIARPVERRGLGVELDLDAIERYRVDDHSMSGNGQSA